MNFRTICAGRLALSIVFGIVTGPALGGLDFTPPQLPHERPPPGSATPPESEMPEKADLPGLHIMPGVSLSPDLGSSSPYAIVDPTNLRQPREPFIRLQVPIPP